MGEYKKQLLQGNSSSEYKYQIEKIDQDHIYVNTVLYNGGSTPIGARFNQSFATAIITNPIEWEVSVIRFNIPTLLIPIFYWGTDTDFSVTLSVSGDDYRNYLVYVPIDTSVDPYRPVHFYQQMVDMINTALSASFASLKAAHGGVSSTTAPYMIFDSTTGMFSILAQTTYVSDSIKLYFNNPLYLYFDNFQGYFNGYNQTNGKDNEIYIKDNKNNTNSVDTSIPSGYYQMNQEFQSAYYWNQFQGFRFTSGTIPTVNENTPSASPGGTTDNFQQILTDFEIQNGGDISSFNSNSQYQPSTFRWTDLQGSKAISGIDYSIYWTDRQLDTYLVMIEPDDSATCKFLFRRKNRLGISSN